MQKSRGGRQKTLHPLIKFLSENYLVEDEYWNQGWSKLSIQVLPPDLPIERGYKIMLKAFHKLPNIHKEMEEHNILYYLWCPQDKSIPKLNLFLHINQLVEFDYYILSVKKRRAGGHQYQAVFRASVVSNSSINQSKGNIYGTHTWLTTCRTEFTRIIISPVLPAIRGAKSISNCR